MSHMPFRMNVPNMGDIPSSVANPKKRRKNVQQNTMPQTAPNVQDLLPPPLSGYGDTIVASNPFDDCPSTMSHSMGMMRGPPMMGGMCRPPLGPPQMPPQMGQPMMHSPNQQSMMNGPMMMNGPPRMHMGPQQHQHPHHMMVSPNGPPMHGIGPPMHSPLGNLGNMQGNGGPMGSPMGVMNGEMMGPGPLGPGPNGPIGPQPPMGPNNNFMMSPMNNMYSKPMPVSAGKVYPADQSMIFNSQNPNAPPIYPCGVCHKEVHDNDQAILCESGCNFWFHRGCTGLTEGAFQMLTAEVYAEWVCDKCLSTKSIPLVKFKP